MQTIAITSGCGGVGRSTITANLASVLAKRRKRVLVVDFDPQNAQRLLLGLDPQQPDGLAREGIDSHAIFDSPFGLAGGDDEPTGLHFIPFGQLAESDLTTFGEDLDQDPNWLRDRIQALDSLGFDLVLIDTPQGLKPFQEQALRASDVALIVVKPDAASYLSLPAIEARIRECTQDRAAFRGEFRLINELPINSRLAHEMRKSLMAHYAQRMVPLSIHQDPAVNHAFAHARPVIDFRPGASASLDFQYLGDWLLDTLDDE